MRMFRWVAVLVPIGWFVAVEVIVRLAQCRYDDVPNLYYCESSWVIPYLENLDMLILPAYLSLAAGLLLFAIRFFRSRRQFLRSTNLV